MCPGFHSRTRRHMWVKFVVGSLVCSEGFSPGTPVFPSPQKPTFPNSIRSWNARTFLNEFLGAPWVNKLLLTFMLYGSIHVVWKIVKPNFWLLFRNYSVVAFFCNGGKKKLVWKSEITEWTVVKSQHVHVWEVVCPRKKNADHRCYYF